MHNINPLLLTDFYKVGHKPMFPFGTSLVYSNFTPRKSRFKEIDHVVFFGLQGFIKQYLIEAFNENFFKRTKKEAVDSYMEFVNSGLGAGVIDPEAIGALHDLGYLPIAIKALPEGSLVPIKVPVLTIYNTHPDFFWLTNYLETLLSTQMWQATTSATLAYHYRKILDKYAKETSDNLAFVDWQGHDFAMRGMSSVESAMLSGAGHLLSFTGTDTIPAMWWLNQNYNASTNTLIGGSVAATEHSVMCAGEKDSEIETFERLITDIYPKGVLSIVSDTWDLWKVLTDYLPKLKEIIEARDGKIVIRPDSGNPVDIICGTDSGDNIIEFKDINLENYKDYLEDVVYDYLECGQGFYEDKWEPILKIEGKLYQAQVKAEIQSSKQDRGDRLYWVEGIESVTITELKRTPAMKGVIELLYEVFGGTVNSKGYIELPSYIGAIYGDSITPERAIAICERLKAKGFASTNVVLGIGSFTYQYNTRDTFGFAMKATYIEVEEHLYPFTERDWVTHERSIFKDPITDDGTKKSAKGLLYIEKDQNGEYILHDQVKKETELLGELELVFQDSTLLKETTLEEVRARLKSY